MSLFSNTRTKRRTVLAVLLVWLFALASSWAHACLVQDRVVQDRVVQDRVVQDRGTQLDSESAVALQAASAPIVSSHVGLVVKHGASFDSGKDATPKVCADEIQIIVKLTSSFDLIEASIAPPIALAWAAHLTATTVDRSALALPARGSVLPLRTRFSRLAL